MEKSIKELKIELQFNTMLLQAYRSLSSCKVPRHYINVQMGWVRRLESEFPLNSTRRFSVDSLKRLISLDLAMCINRIQDGTKIIKIAFNEARPKA